MLLFRPHGLCEALLPKLHEGEHYFQVDDVQPDPKERRAAIRYGVPDEQHQCLSVVNA